MSPGPRGSPGRAGSGAGKVSARVAAGPLALGPLPPLTVQLWPCRANRAGRSDEPDLEVALPSQKHSHRPEGPVATPSSALSGRDVGPVRRGAAPPASQARIRRGRPRFGARPPCSDITPQRAAAPLAAGPAAPGAEGPRQQRAVQVREFRCVRSGACVQVREFRCVPSAAALVVNGLLTADHVPPTPPPWEGPVRPARRLVRPPGKAALGPLPTRWTEPSDARDGQASGAT